MTAAAEVEGVRVTHPDKVLFPRDGITKLDLARYYAGVAPWLLPYVARRPLTLRTYPQGIEGQGIYMKRVPKGAPSWIETFRDQPAPLRAGQEREPVDYVIARDGEDARTLVWTAQYNAVEVHPWLSRMEHPDSPDWAVLDLDLHGAAGEAPDAFPRLALAARLLRERLGAAHGLEVYPKLSGQSGVHLLLPLEPGHSFEAVRGFLVAEASAAAEAHPELLTTDYDIADRGGRVLIDYAQNGRGRHTVAPYSVRPRSGAPVSAPVTWEELEGPRLRADRWSLRTIGERLASVGDVLAPALTRRQRLPPA
ncbi:MAG TPA: non-homologous end-joining DNA ligase [Chloroflexota bacterium]|nr:non-homologous end-joining DNA ligase [Chloroflexota bacterium]